MNVRRSGDYQNWTSLNKGEGRGQILVILWVHNNWMPPNTNHFFFRNTLHHSTSFGLCYKNHLAKTEKCQKTTHLWSHFVAYNIKLYLEDSFESSGFSVRRWTSSLNFKLFSYSFIVMRKGLLFTCENPHKNAEPWWFQFGFDYMYLIQYHFFFLYQYPFSSLCTTFFLLFHQIKTRFSWSVHLLVSSLYLFLET